MKRKYVFFVCLIVLISVCVFKISKVVSAEVILAQTIDDREQALRNELETIEKEIAEQKKILTTKKTETASIARDVAILNAQILEAQLSIKAKNITISNLAQDIGKKSDTIQTLEARISREQESMSQLIQKTHESDATNLVDLVLSGKQFSDFFTTVDNYSVIKRALSKLYDDVQNTKSDTVAEREGLDRKRGEELDARAVIEEKKGDIERAEAEKNKLLSASKLQEKAYEFIVAGREAKAAQIRSALFALRDSDGIPFGDALQHALDAQRITGVRPAYVLAILSQESSLGKNLGSCYLRDVRTGSGVGKNTGDYKARVMNPTRDVPIFLNILQSLGRDPFTSQVSCWIAIYDSLGKPSGWGGAMGPAQFIPSTWKLFQNRIATAVGSATADPWLPKDAIFASSIYLGDLGAGNGGYSAERDAACRYYSGSRCPSGKRFYSSRERSIINYGDSVMKRVANIQTTMIDPILGIGS